MMATTGSNDYLQWHVYICTSCAGLVAAAAATTGGQILGSASLPASKIVPEIAIEYSLGRWAALVRYLDDGDLPIDNNHVENRIRPVALGRYKCIFAGSLRAGQRAANVMSLIQSAKLNGHDPYRYLKDVLERLSTQPASRLEELLPHRWQFRT